MITNSLYLYENNMILIHVHTYQIWSSSWFLSDRLYKGFKFWPLDPSTHEGNSTFWLRACNCLLHYTIEILSLINCTVLVCCNLVQQLRGRIIILSYVCHRPFLTVNNIWAVYTTKWLSCHSRCIHISIIDPTIAVEVIITQTRWRSHWLRLDVFITVLVFLNH